VLIHPEEVDKRWDDYDAAPHANHPGQYPGRDSNESTAQQDFHSFS
jgi:hypothetical protein